MRKTGTWDYIKVFVLYEMSLTGFKIAVSGYVFFSKWLCVQLVLDYNIIVLHSEEIAVLLIFL